MMIFSDALFPTHSGRKINLRITPFVPEMFLKLLEDTSKNINPGTAKFLPGFSIWLNQLIVYRMLQFTILNFIYHTRIQQRGGIA
ncbi:MAG: hypothetical protein JWR61_5504 [Ferruginibacter sp.]|nr:hypothetical protein [Ferruginibacter sp.]